MATGKYVGVVEIIDFALREPIKTKTKNHTNKQTNMDTKIYC
jgi:hypothetical protein